MGVPWDFCCRFYSSHLLDSSSSLALSESFQKSGICFDLKFLPLDLEDDLPLLLFTGVTGGTNVALLAGVRCPSTRLTSEASQLAGQAGGPNSDRPLMTPYQTPHMFGITYASITVWLKTILSIFCRYVHTI